MKTNSTSLKYAVLVNLAANNGRAAQRWDLLAPVLAKQLPSDTAIRLFRPSEEVEPYIRRWLKQEGRTCFVSAGGDGSANALLNILARLTNEKMQGLYLGGVGLGSSNDFIKPVEQRLANFPTRLEMSGARLADVGKVEYQTPAGKPQIHYFIINASLGVTAEANWCFNQEDWLIRRLKSHWTDGAILYSALRTILTFKNLPVVLAIDDEPEEALALSNLAVLKCPYVSGSFHFDDPVQRDDGFLGLNLCLDMRKTELIGVLAALSKGRFRRRPKTRTLAAHKLRVRSEKPLALEMDGEVVLAQDIYFSVLPRAIGLLS